MTRDRFAATLLIVGTVGSLITMAFHPTGAEALQDAAAGGDNLIARAVHALALAMLPLVLTGLLQLTVRLEDSRGLAVLACVMATLGTFAVLVAAVASGLLAPDLAGDVAGAAGADRSALLQQLHLVGAINQAFAKVYVAMMGGALVLWSLAMRRAPDFSGTLSAVGLLVGVLELAGVLSGHLRLDVHGFGAVVLAQGLWMVWTAVVLGRTRA